MNTDLIKKLKDTFECGIDLLYENDTCNRLFCEAKYSSESLAPWKSLVRNAGNYGKDCITFGATRTNVYNGGYTAFKAQANPIECDEEYKTETWGSLHVRDFKDFCHDDILHWRSLQNNECTNSIVNALAPSVAKTFEALAESFELTKVWTVISGLLEGKMKILVKNSFGGTNWVEIDTGVPHLSFVNAPGFVAWNDPNAPIVKYWRTIVRESSKCCRFKKAYMNYSTFDTLFCNKSIQMCCEQRYQGILNGSETVLPRIENVEIVIVDGYLNYQDPVTGEKFNNKQTMPDGKILFLCDEPIYDYWDLLNIDRPCSPNGACEDLFSTQNYGSVFTLETVNQPSGMSMIHSNHHALVPTNNNGALCVQAY